jgi:hypothetical protein
MEYQDSTSISSVNQDMTDHISDTVHSQTISSPEILATEKALDILYSLYVLFSKKETDDEKETVANSIKMLQLDSKLVNCILKKRCITHQCFWKFYEKYIDSYENAYICLPRVELKPLNKCPESYRKKIIPMENCPPLNIIDGTRAVFVKHRNDINIVFTTDIPDDYHFHLALFSNDKYIETIFRKPINGFNHQFITALLNSSTKVQTRHFLKYRSISAEYLLTSKDLCELKLLDLISMFLTTSRTFYRKIIDIFTCEYMSLLETHAPQTVKKLIEYIRRQFINPRNSIVASRDILYLDSNLLDSPGLAEKIFDRNIINKIFHRFHCNPCLETFNNISILQKIKTHEGHSFIVEEWFNRVYSFIIQNGITELVEPAKEGLAYYCKHYHSDALADYRKYRTEKIFTVKIDMNFVNAITLYLFPDTCTSIV